MFFHFKLCIQQFERDLAESYNQQTATIFDRYDLGLMDDKELEHLLHPFTKRLRRHERVIDLKRQNLKRLLHRRQDATFTYSATKYTSALPKYVGFQRQRMSWVETGAE